MKISKILIINLIIINLNTCNGQYIPKSPCPNVFSYRQDNYGRIFGLIAVNNIEINRINYVQLKLAGLNPIKNLEAVGTTQVFFDSVRSGNPIYFKFEFSFYTNNIPEVIEIISNGEVICSNYQIDSSGISILTSELSLTESTNYSPYLPQRQPIYQRPQFQLENRIAQQVFEPLFRQQSPPYNSLQPNNFLIPNPLNRVTTPQQQQLSRDNTNPLFRHLNKNCGIAEAVTKLVFGGREFRRQRGAWPWLTALFRSSTTSFICGGSLISKTTVLTAAHCFRNNVNLKDYIMGIGVYDLKKRNEEGSLYLNLRQITLHHDYNPSSIRIYADIAITILDTAVNFNKYIRPICLLDNTDNIVDQVGVVAGWGLTDNVTMPNIPMFVESKIVSHVNCLTSHDVLARIASNTTFCAVGSASGVTVRGIGPCEGDSGGGLMLRKNNKWFLRGIVSETVSHEKFRCDLENYVIYTDVAQFMNWIERTMDF